MNSYDQDGEAVMLRVLRNQYTSVVEFRADMLQRAGRDEDTPLRHGLERKIADLFANPGDHSAQDLAGLLMELQQPNLFKEEIANGAS